MKTIEIGIVVTLLLCQVYSICPSACNCPNTSSPTSRCLLCLKNFHRAYPTPNSDCPCIPGFREQMPISDYCCPANCSLCADSGCFSCKRNWQLHTDDSNLTVCVCQSNYYPKNNDCDCLSATQPQLYYKNHADESCLRCPDGCVCSVAGCGQCQDPNRLIQSDYLDRKTCLCRSPYVEIDDKCQIPFHCQLATSETLSCTRSSNRQQSTDQKWYCRSNYVEVNGNCTCLEPFTLIQFQARQQCVCNSQINSKDYYSFGKLCTKCPSGCVCDDYGCSFCSASTNRLVLGGKCACKVNFAEILGKCVCVEPNYLDAANNCTCMDKFSSAMYVFDPWGMFCYKCPQGCSCDQTGCVHCQSSSLRTAYSGQCYSCVPYAEEVDGICRCSSLAQLDGNGITCKCRNSTMIYTDRSNLRCLVCPTGCTCTERAGCSSCIPTASRVTYNTGGGYKMCPCRSTFVEVNGVCTCNGIISDDATQCLCSAPYNSDCTCKEAENYLDLVNNLCISCPQGCSCDEEGCKACSSDSLRYSYLSSNTILYHPKWECPCLQRAILIDQKCKYCREDQYFLNRKCVSCKRCLVCNQQGCTSCGDGLTLVDGDCVCNEIHLINQEGLCVCPSGQAIGLDDYNATVCTPCQQNCLECTKTNKTLQCSSCRENSNRYNSPQNNCPCLVGYKEKVPVSQYCCHQNCSSCDEYGCTNCSVFSNRQLRDQSCLCVGNLIEIEGGPVCGCAEGKYVYMGYCLTCPPNCRNCSYLFENNTIICLTCPNNSNRIKDSSCSCMNKFIESSPVTSFCTPSNCLTDEPVCSQCKSGYLLINNGSTCRCLTGYFENVTAECQQCSATGCIDCFSSSICLSCNETEGYYLTGTQCKLNMDPRSYIFSQNREEIIIQFVVQGANTSFALESFEASIETINDSSRNSVLLTVYEAVFSQGNTLIVRLSHPSQPFNNCLLALSYLLTIRPNRVLASWNATDSKGPFTAQGLVVYLKKDRILSQPNISTGRWSILLEQILTVLIMAVSYPLYVYGFKHNQVIFFLQTLAFMSFTLKDDQYTAVEYLYELRYSYFGFGSLFAAVFPPHYLEHSPGNFHWWTTDSNILRVAGTPLAVAVVLAILSLLLRAISWLIMGCSRRKCSWFFVMHAAVKKPVYRTIQFLYKTCMYPLVFFSLVTLQQWESVTLLNPQLKQFCSILCAVLVGGFTLVLVWQVFFETVANINKFENLCEFLSVALNSLIITRSVYSSAYLALIAVVLIRAVAYVLIRVRYFRGFTKLEFIRLASALLESLTLCLMLTHSPIGLWVSSFMTIGVMLAHQILVLHAINAQIDQNRSITVSGSLDSSSLEVKDDKQSSVFDQYEEASHGRK